MTPPLQTQTRLNRALVSGLADNSFAKEDPAPQDDLLTVLRAAGANDDDLERVGLLEALMRENPQKNLDRLLFGTMPPAGHTPFNSILLRNWFFRHYEFGRFRGMRFQLLGSSPFSEEDLRQFLESRGMISSESQGVADLYIVGRSDWNASDLDDLIERHEGRTLKIYSQEMILAALALDSDPLRANHLVLSAFRAGHPGLEFLSKGWPGWVESWVSHDRQPGGLRKDYSQHVSESPLAVMGYRVGRTGEDAQVRREILSRAFQHELPPVHSANYMSRWGIPKSAERLRQIAEHLAYECRRRRGRQGYEDAVADWENDLAWLKSEFYRGHMQFRWPDTMVD